MSLTVRVAPERLLGQALHGKWTKFRTVSGPSIQGTASEHELVC